MQERKLGLLGKKLGMTQFFDDKGHMVPVTVIEVGPCTILAKRSEAVHENGKSDGYSALQLGFDNKKEKKVSKPEAGHVKKSGGVAKKFVKEIRVKEAELAKYEVGAELTVALFEGEKFVDVIGTAKGCGFQGVMKRHNHHGFGRTHGAHEYKRHVGSIGCRNPTRVTIGKNLPGHMGNNQVTTQNIKVTKIDAARNLLLINGSVPGKPGSYVVVRPAIKKMGK